jgi:hypothetical protein
MRPDRYTDDAIALLRGAEARPGVARDLEPTFTQTVPQWPDPLVEEAFYGPLGEWIRRIEPETEADAAALLVQALVAVGSVIGRGPHFRAESDRHYPVLFAAIVGKTSKGRKGTSEGRVRALFESVDKDWALRRTKTGLSSGEGLVFEVRDATTGKNVDPGESDKRLLVIEPEFAAVFQACERAGNTLSAIVRRAWDSPALLAPMTKTNRCEATNPHISIVGHITRDELRRLLSDTAIANGFANRFLWVCSSRSKCLPDGGRDLDVSDLAERIRTAVEFARGVGEVRRDSDASLIWHRVYADLSDGKPGMLGAVTGRAEAQVMRLACIYALVDSSGEIRAPHMVAALAIWQYCLESARYIFGDSLGDPVADEIRRLLRSQPAGVTRTELRDHFGRNRSAAQIGSALAVLAEYGQAVPEHRDSGGRPVEVWCAK